MKTRSDLVDTDQTLLKNRSDVACILDTSFQTHDTDVSDTDQTSCDERSDVVKTRSDIVNKVQPL